MDAARDACRRFARGGAKAHAAPLRAVACPRAGRASRGRASRGRVIDALRGAPGRRTAQAGLAAECGCGKL
ncbi:hypothetical protein E5U26_33640 [Burkholderia pseudomallei]|uniref:hypothetical protein n=1 Tax=Burkholderia pseudomallei TaxID=28450 RepID=UPI00281536FE|nr:hypothetical protein [Burkholderia pseudomallei]NRE35386.1 hypothetical protein [Burkholderia pseudomallei]